MKPISFEHNGFPEFLRSESACQKAIERGTLRPDTLIIAFGDGGLRERMTAAEHPLLSGLFQSEEAPPDDVAVIADAPEIADEDSNSTLPDLGRKAPEPLLVAEAGPELENDLQTPAEQSSMLVTSTELSQTTKIIWAAIAVLLLIVMISNCDRRTPDAVAVTAEDSLVAASDAAAAASAAPSQTYFASREIAVRSKASKDSARVTLLPRGTQFVGFEVPSITQSGFSWLQITQGQFAGNFVSMRNLSANEPPELDTSNAGYWYLTEALIPREGPSDGATAKSDAAWNLAAGTRVEVAGVTGGGVFSNGWAEIMLDKEAGVGYVPFDSLTRDPAAESANAAMVVSDAATPVAEAGPASRGLMIKNTCSYDLNMLIRYRSSAGWLSSVVSLPSRQTTFVNRSGLISDEVYFLNLVNLPNIDRISGSGSAANIDGRSYSLSALNISVQAGGANYTAEFSPCD